MSAALPLADLAANSQKRSRRPSPKVSVLGTEILLAMGSAIGGLFFRYLTS